MGAPPTFSLRASAALALAVLAAMVVPAADASRRVHGVRATARRVIWSDEFRGAAGSGPSSAKWSSATGGGGWGNGELEYYTPRRANAALDGRGDLVITARAEPYTGADGISRMYTSARLQTQGLFATEYGRIEARIRIPQGRGLWPAFWMLGENIATAGWPACGEIDAMESLGKDPFTLYGSIHGPQAGRPRGYGITAPKRSAVSLAGGFHDYGVIWSPAAVTFTLDGVRYATQTPASLAPGQSWVFNRPFYLLLDLAVGGSWPGSPDASTHFPAQMLVKWVRVYSS